MFVDMIHARQAGTVMMYVTSFASVFAAFPSPMCAAAARVAVFWMFFWALFCVDVSEESNSLCSDHTRVGVVVVVVVVVVVDI